MSCIMIKIQICDLVLISFYYTYAVYSIIIILCLVPHNLSLNFLLLLFITIFVYTETIKSDKINQIID